MTTVGIDPGHGGRDTGCVVDGLVERDFVEDVAKRMSHALSEHGVDSLLTRQPGSDPFFITRGYRTRNCRLVVVLHVNASYDRRVNGLECYHWPGSVEGVSLANLIASRAPLELYPIGMPHKSPHVWSCTDLPDEKDDWLQHPRNCLARHIPTAVLVEMGYASNFRNHEFLTEKSTPKVLAENIAASVSFWLGLPTKTA